MNIISVLLPDPRDMRPVPRALELPSHVNRNVGRLRASRRVSWGLTHDAAVGMAWAMSYNQAAVKLRGYLT